MGGAADDDIVRGSVLSVRPVGSQPKTIRQALIGVGLVPGIHTNHSGKVAGAEVVDRN